MGAAAALLLALALAAGWGLAMLAWRATAVVRARVAIRGDRPAARRAGPVAVAALVALALGYGALLAMLAFASVVPRWPFPALWPPGMDLQAWTLALTSGGTLGHTLSLGLASAASGLLLALAWLEASPSHWDARAAPLIFLPLWWPGILLAAGLYRALLPIGMDGSWAAVWLAHVLYTAPYALVALAPAYRAFDPRYAQVARALGRGGVAFLWQVKWPMLLAPLAAAFAVAFAVSVAQYLSTQYLAGGRWPTLATEALTLAAGGQRDRMAAFALLQAGLPALVFALAAAIGLRQLRRTGGDHGGRP